MFQIPGGHRGKNLAKGHGNPQKKGFSGEWDPQNFFERGGLFFRSFPQKQRGKGAPPGGDPKGFLKRGGKKSFFFFLGEFFPPHFQKTF
ncbi:hypothetical protein EBI_26566 [Enterocytozoon bieneusi H348]|nr:hypothetical protein EBI_26566 [Enterocytozoon bieneusi H348]|eukprot:XP_002651488.1 hypothetical protein EBI_26566 [Enterocytozoon bieneusi H348]